MKFKYKINFKKYYIMDLNNIIKILPNIYLGNNCEIDTEFIKNNLIKTIILINDANNISKFNDLCNLININFDTNSNYINFNYTNNLIFDQVTHMQNILIISNKNLLGFIIVSAFMINYLNVSFFKILILDKAYNIGLVNTNLYKLLYDYYCIAIK